MDRTSRHGKRLAALVLAVLGFMGVVSATHVVPTPLGNTAGNINPPGPSGNINPPGPSGNINPPGPSITAH